MNRYNAQILNDKGEYHLQFETNSRDNFNDMEKLAQKCIDNKPKTNFDRITESVEFADWIYSQYGGSPPDMPCKDTSCEKPNCKECFKEWLQKECEG